METPIDFTLHFLPKHLLYCLGVPIPYYLHVDVVTCTWKVVKGMAS